jgi:hypothetical protein
VCALRCVGGGPGRPLPHCSGIVLVAARAGDVLHAPRSLGSSHLPPAPLLRPPLPLTPPR